MDEITSFMLQQMKEIDERDESQIVAELAGETIQDYIYEVTNWDPRQRRRITKVKLSWVGVKECARGRGNIVLSEPAVEDLPDSIRIMVRATDMKRNFTVFGGCHQPRKMKVNDYEGDVITGHHFEDDPYCFQKGLSKAQRNALNLCIPAEFMAKTIQKFALASGKGHLLGDPRGKKQPPTEGKETAENKKPPSKQQLERSRKWEEYKPEDIPNMATLEKVIWDITKKQPAEMYKELGVRSRMEITISPWDAFLTLKAVWGVSPPDQEGTPPPSEQS